MTDHHIVTCRLSLPSKATRRRVSYYREIAKFDVESFKEDLERSDLVTANSNLQLNELVDLYDSELRTLLDKHAPLRKRTVRVQRREPWCNASVLEKRREMRAAERQWYSDRTDANRSVLDVHRSAFKQLLEDSRTRYYSDLIEDNCRDPKTLFQTVSRVMNRTKSNPLPDHVSASTLANEFSDFFFTKVANIRATFDDSATLDDAMQYDVPFNGAAPLEQFACVSVADITKVINKSPNKSCELDPIPTSLLKQCVGTLAPVITRITNLSLEISTVPRVYKCAIVRPLLKKSGLDTVLKNYRPVSNLSFVSKLLEDVVIKQVSHHLTHNSLYESLQSAYKPRHSTETALLRVFDDILSNLDKRNHAVFVCLLDLSAAFDTVDHRILLHRMEKTFGIRGRSLKWLTSYLSDRSMKVCVGGRYSKSVRLDVAVPQGSKFGPRLYSEYTHPLGILIRILLLLYHLYADDSQLLRPTALTPVDRQYEAVRHLASAVTSIQHWMKNNKLKLNPEKTEFMIIASSKNRYKVDVASLALASGDIPGVDCVRNLGVHMDSALDMQVHITKLCQTCYMYIRWIRRIRSVLTPDATKSLVQALVISRLDYCNGVLVGLPNTSLNKLQRVMNVAARLITGIPRDGSIRDALRTLHWLPIQARIVFKLCAMVYKALHGLSPEYISELIVPCTSSRAMRSNESGQLRVNRTRSQYGDRAFSVAASRCWNALPTHIRTASSENSFRRLLKTHLFREHLS